MIGLLEHFLVGTGIVIVAILFGTFTYIAPNVPFVITYVFFAGHEIGDGDLTTAPMAPWNGLLDIAIALPIPTLYWILA